MTGRPEYFIDENDINKEYLPSFVIIISTLINEKTHLGQFTLWLTNHGLPYLGAIISNEGSEPEILSRIAFSKLKIIWRDKNISLASKIKLMRTLILSTFFYACESWTLTAELKRRIHALEMRCYMYRRLLNISHKDHVTYEEVCNKIQNAIGVHDDL